ncbi:hypothetical protein BU17DRAFT_38744, partial [Hysterangium stoloniferum]
VYISSRTTKECDATANELSAMGPGECISVPANLQIYDEVQKLVNVLKAKEKVLHVLVNNAGATWGDDIDEHPDAAFTKILTLNVQRIFTLTQLCLPLLRTAALEGGKNGSSFNDPARIINIRKHMPAGHTYTYSASKMTYPAPHHLSRHIGGRLGWEGITSNTIACGK